MTIIRDTLPVVNYLIVLFLEMSQPVVYKDESQTERLSRKTKQFPFFPAGKFHCFSISFFWVMS